MCRISLLAAIGLGPVDRDPPLRSGPEELVISPDFSPVEVAVYARREARCHSSPMHLASATLQVSERGETPDAVRSAGLR
jgi:hypothetical protein